MLLRVTVAVLLRLRHRLVVASCGALQVRKRDGAVGYDSTDLAAIRFRLLEEKYNWLIYVVDSGQSLRFDVRSRAAFWSLQWCVVVLTVGSGACCRI